jgi:hypothetical protein
MPKITIKQDDTAPQPISKGMAEANFACLSPRCLILTPQIQKALFYIMSPPGSTGLVQQTLQIVEIYATLRSHDLTLFVGSY